MMGILIKNAMIVTMDEDREVINNGYVLIEGDKFIEVRKGDYLGETQNLAIIDGNGYCVMPGLINCHTHAAMTLLRGYGEGLPLMRWLNEKIWPMESKFNENHIKIGTEIAILEMLRTGTTAFNDMYFYQDSVMEVCKEFNMRVSLGIPIIGDHWKEQLRSAENLINIVDKENNNLIRTMIAPHSPYTLSKEALKDIGCVAKNYNKGVHIHIAETEDEINIIKERYNMTPCELLSSTDIFNNKVVGAHCVHLTDNDIKILKDNQVSPVYNPQSNMKLASGTARILEMLNNDINVCIGTDGTSSNNNLNMFEEMETGALLQKLWYKEPTALDGKTILKMATQNGARALGFDNVGVIKSGNYADLIMVNLNKPNMVPVHDIYSNLVFASDGSEIKYVIINGKIVMSKGEFINIDEEKVIFNCNKICRELV